MWYGAAMDAIRLTPALVDSLFHDAIARLEAGEPLPNDDALIQAATDYLANRYTHRTESVLSAAAAQRLKRKLAKARAEERKKAS